METRLDRLEAQNNGQDSPVGITTGTTKSSFSPSPCAQTDVVSQTDKVVLTTTCNTDASGHPQFDASSRNFEEDISNISLSHGHRCIRDVHLTTKPESSHPRHNSPTSLCSSNPAFLRSLDVGWSLPVENSTNTRRVPPLPDFLWKRLDSSASIPTRTMADDLLHSFFAFAHEFLPIFYKPAFYKQYEELWIPSVHSGPRDPLKSFEDNIFLSTLNMCFSLGSLFSQLVHDENRACVSNDYYLRSRALTNFDICDYSSLSTVRLQLITGLYLQTTSNVSRCWNVVGMAIRLAQDLGLHKCVSGHAESGRIEVEMERRVWHSCVMMDM